VAVAITAFGASAAPVLVDFDNDPAPFLVANGFESVDSSQIAFSDSINADLAVVNFDGSNALIVGIDDASELIIELDSVATKITLDFGNTDGADLLETAILTTYIGGIGGVEVGTIVVPFNFTNAIDQTIMFEGAEFDSAIFRYSAADSPTEVVDNIEITFGAQVPEANAGLVFGVGALLFGAVCRRRTATGVKPRAVHD
jgi:hypothetical protein